jgi:hypothetical protein
MKIIEPSVGLWKQGDDVKAHVAKCARVCYGKETGNDDVTINTLLKKHHWSMFRHESVYVIFVIMEHLLNVVSEDIILLLKNGLKMKILFAGMKDYLNVKIMFLLVDILILAIYNDII